MMLEVALQHRFAGFALDVGFAAPAGVTALFGPSGSGKTSVINAVAGLLQPDQGRIVLGGRVLCDTASGAMLPPHRRRLGYVFQQPRLFAHLTVRQNLTYGRWFAPHGAITLDQVVDLLGIGALLNRRPAGLSGGEASRVSIGRALLANPQILLMDEPLSALDDARKAEILPFLEQLRDQTRLPILYVSHSVSEVARLADHVVLLQAGRVMASGPVAQVLSDPQAATALGPRGAGAVIVARVAAHEGDGLTRLETSAGPIWLPQVSAPIGARLRVRIAAQDVIVARAQPVGLSALNILPAMVTALRIGSGPGAMVQLRAGDDLLLARVTQRSVQALNLTEGAQVFAVLKSVVVAPRDIGGDIGAGRG